MPEVAAARNFIARSTLFSNPLRMLEDIIQSRGMKLSDEEKVAVVVLATGKAILERREPVRKDVVDSLGVVFNLEET
jgi:hypothetical protein